MMTQHETAPSAQLSRAKHIPQRLWHALLEPSPELTEPDQRRQAVLLSGFLLALVFLAAVVEITTATFIDWTSYTGYRQTLFAIILMLFVYRISRTRYLQLAAVLAVVSMSFAVFVSGWGEPRGIAGGLFDYLILPLWLGSLFIDLDRLPILIAGVLAALLLFPFTAPEVTLNQILVGPFSFVLATSIILLVVTRHRNKLEHDRRAELSSLVKDVQRVNAELSLAYDSTIEGWSRALDLRDKETEGHSQRVTEMTLQLARAMGVSEEELIHIRRGALLHDIGKMGVPDQILLKPDKLTDDEWVIMRKHPVYAYELLTPIPYLRPALDIPHCHHEKWDGTGYPRGLKGEQIPFAARLFALIDVVDALRSDRPYRKGWPEERVIEHIRAQSGTHFDPRVVEAFLQLPHER
jgi:putative nucleotidyltransferase with HDIG domain